MSESLSPDVARAVRRVLNEILRKTAVVNAEVARINDLLDGVPPPPDANGDGRTASSSPAAGPSAGPKPELGMPKHYEVRDVDGEPRLLEYRDGSDTPFAVPHGFYAAFADTTAQHS